MTDKQKFQETFSALHASGECMTEVLKMTTQKETMPRRWVLGSALAAVLCLVMVVSFGNMALHPTAAPEEPREVYENAAQIVELLYGGDEDYDSALAERYLEPYFYPVEGSISMEGFTLTAEAAVFDPVTGCGYLYYTVENPDGMEGYWDDTTKILDANTTGEYDLGANYPKPVSNYGIGRIWFDEISTNTKYYMMTPIVYHEMLWDDVEGLTKQAVEAGLEDQLQEILRSARGEKVTLRFVKAGGDRSDSILITPDPAAGMEWVTFDGGNVRLSPIGMTICENAYPVEGGPWPGSFIPYSIVIHFADGSKFIVDQRELDEDECLVQKVSGFINWLGYRHDNKDYITMHLDQLIDVKQVVSVEINGTEYPVDQYE